MARFRNAAIMPQLLTGRPVVASRAKALFSEMNWAKQPPRFREMRSSSM
jgi:hypothetical protein